jgi:hypothetical protein
MPIAADQATFLSRCMDTLDSTLEANRRKLVGPPASTILDFKYYRPLSTRTNIYKTLLDSFTPNYNNNCYWFNKKILYQHKPIAMSALLEMTEIM